MKSKNNQDILIDDKRNNEPEIVSDLSELSSADIFNGQALIPGVGRRALAYMIDLFLVAGIGFLIHMLILRAISGTDLAAMLGNLYVLALIIFLVNACYHVFSESNPVLRATLGKFICGLQVVDVDGCELDRRQSIIRFAWRLPSIALFFFPYLIMGRGNYGLALHDLRAFTVVTTRMESKRLQSGLLAGRQKTRMDKAFLVLCALFLTYLLFSVVSRLISILSV